MNNSNTQTTTSALLSPVTLEQELDLFFVILLDSYYHSLKGLIEVCLFVCFFRVSLLFV